jgi:hypothetical protein
MSTNGKNNDVKDVLSIFTEKSNDMTKQFVQMIEDYIETYCDKSNKWIIFNVRNGDSLVANIPFVNPIVKVNTYFHIKDWMRCRIIIQHREIFGSRTVIELDKVNVYQYKCLNENTHMFKFNYSGLDYSITFDYTNNK